MNTPLTTAVSGRSQLVSALVLALVVLLSALAVVQSTDLNRDAWNQLQTLKSEKQQLQVEWGQLLLQQSTLTTPIRIERLAISKLQMKVPALDEVVVIQQ